LLKLGRGWGRVNFVCEERQMKEALYFDLVSEGGVQCSLCPCLCPISPSRHGQCGVRLNRNGKLYSMTYGRVSTEEIISIESLPLYHFYPGSKFLLIGTMGCTFHCPFCNTWRVSQSGTRTRLVPPEELVKLAQTQGAAHYFHPMAQGFKNPRA